jgi:hypothetical protein
MTMKMEVVYFCETFVHIYQITYVTYLKFPLIYCLRTIGIIQGNTRKLLLYAVMYTAMTLLGLAQFRSRHKD